MPATRVNAPADDLFADARTHAVGDLAEPVPVSTEEPLVVAVTTGLAHATRIGTRGGIAPARGRQVVLEAQDAVLSWTTQEGKRKTVHTAPATPDALRRLTWRAHCGGTWLPRPDAAHPAFVARSSRTIPTDVEEWPPLLNDQGPMLEFVLPADATGATVVAAAYGPEHKPRASFFQAVWVEGGRAALERMRPLATLEQMAQLVGRTVAPPGTPGGRLLRMYYELLGAHWDEAGITTAIQQAHFFAQVRHESINMTAVIERGDASYLGANAAFKGVGLMQLTGPGNYADALRGVYGIDPSDLSPAQLASEGHRLLAMPEGAVRSALWYWRDRKCNDSADVDDVLGVSIKVNGWNDKYAVTRPGATTPEGSYLPNHYDVRARYTLAAKQELGYAP